MVANWDNTFYLMNKDEVILKFVIQKDAFGETSFDIIEEYKNLKPIGFNNITSWLNARQAPKHRLHIENLLKQCGCYDLDGYIRVTHALTLNDTFWIKPENSILKWKNLSLYTNDFNETISHIAFEGGLYGENFSSTSPEFGTDGTYAKCWIKRNDSIYLLKQGSSGARNTGLEPYSEFYASQISKLICNNTVDYDLEMYRGKLVSSCELFTNENIGFVPIDKIVGRDNRVSNLLSYFEGKGFGDDFRRMLVLDALIINTDRHLGNFGVLIDNSNMNVIGMAPIFDNNQSLLPYAEKPDFDDLDNYLESRTTKLGADFNQVAHQVLTSEIKADLNNLKGFKFKHHDKYNLSDERLTKLEGLIEKQIFNIINDIHLYVPTDLKKENNIDGLPSFKITKEDRYKSKSSADIVKNKGTDIEL